MPDDDVKMTGPLDLPMQPTGSGVADLEIAREQDAVIADEEATGDRSFGDVTASGAE